MRPYRPFGLALVVLSWAAVCSAQPVEPGVRDRAGMFSPDAVQKATGTLGQLARETHWNVVIETVNSFEGQPPRDAVLAKLKTMDLRGLYVLISKGDHKVEIEPSGSAEQAFPRDEVRRLVQMLVDSFRAKEFDRGLSESVTEIARRARQHPDRAALAQGRAESSAAKAGVRDHARMFSTDAVEKADRILHDVDRASGWKVVVESITSLEGESVKDRAIANAKALNVHGLYVLLAKSDHRVHMEPSNSAKTVFTREKIAALTSTVTSAFKAGDFDRGLLALAEQVQKDTSTPSVASNPLAGPTTPAPPKPAAVPIPGDAPAGQDKPGSIVPMLIVGGIGVIVLFWLMGKVFGRKPPQVVQQGGWQSPGGGPSPAPAPPRPAPGPGYAPPGGYAPGYGPPPAGPGYPPPGYGAPPPQRGGGGFVTGMLGGAAGAIAGNIIYDQFGRPHHVEGGEPHAPIPGAAPPHDYQGGAPYVPPQESYDPNAGASGDWGGGEAAPPAQAPDQWGNPEGASGDWGGSDPAADAGASGDWGSSEPAADSEGAGGDWGSPDPADDNGGDTGGGGDWGGGDSSSDDQNQGGSW